MQATEPWRGQQERKEIMLKPVYEPQYVRNCSPATPQSLEDTHAECRWAAATINAPRSILRQNHNAAEGPQGTRRTRGWSTHQSPEGAQNLLSSVAPGPGQGPALAAGPTSGPAVLPRAQSPTRLTSGRQCLAPLLRSLARCPRARGQEHRTRLQQPRAPVTAQLPVPRGRLNLRRLHSSHASGPDLHQGTFRDRISSDFSALGPAALQDPQGVSATSAVRLVLPGG
ncbi:hypothetical protein NDU88_002212 [Pleurodeles waltl]|uniref:Uncharacterized protein n=1 Tax=Pleurodeles waltl TaxID=8319 RepID=A0AAV7NHC3_PLEWA|nr:hypothetical protein NDU88_002212 [Pleurodeles waltl]